MGRRQTTEHAHAGHSGRGRVLSNANRNPMGCGSVLIHSAERKVRIHRSPARSLRTISSEAAKPPLPFLQWKTRLAMSKPTVVISMVDGSFSSLHSTALQCKLSYRRGGRAGV